VRYLDLMQIEYNRTPYQCYDQSNCGQLCLHFLHTVTINLRIDIIFFQFTIHSNMSLTLALTSSVLAACYFPAVDLSDGNYELGLMDFETDHTISNVNSLNNKFFTLTKMTKKLSFSPEGSYEIRDINKYLRREILQFHPNDVARERKCFAKRMNNIH